MPFVLSLTPVSVRSLSGHTVIVEPQVPAQIPQLLLNESLAAGCVLCNERGEVLISGKAFRLVPVENSVPAAEVSDPAKDLSTRNATIKKVLEEMEDVGDLSNYSNLTGMPKTNVVSAKCGFKVSAEEIREMAIVAATRNHA